MRRLLESALFIALTALCFRLLILGIAWHHGFADASGPYGFEVGAVASSIVQGKGFSSPSPLVDTGPTAWLCPIYPYMVAGVFKIWGVYTTKSHMILQVMNCLFSALIIFPLYSLSSRVFGERVAAGGAWLWTFLPTAWHIPIAYIWESALSALFFALLFWATLAIRGRTRLLAWAGYGILWAVALMVNASFLSLLPFFFLWFAWQAHVRRVHWFPQLACASLVLLIGLVPWTIRNYRAFHTFVLLRNNVGAMLWWGNNAVYSTTDPFAKSPLRDPEEALEFQRLGEVGYMRAKGKIAIEFIRSHPLYTSELIARRLAMNWLSVSDRVNSAWRDDPAYLKLYSFANAAMVLLCWYGLVIFLRSGTPEALPFLIVLVVYPLVYYLTVTLVRYRFPIEPLIAVLSVYGATHFFARVKAKVFPPASALQAFWDNSKAS